MGKMSFGSIDGTAPAGGEPIASQKRSVLAALRGVHTAEIELNKHMSWIKDIHSISQRAESATPHMVEMVRNARRELHAARVAAGEVA